MAFSTNIVSEHAQEKALRKTGERITGINEYTRMGVRARIKEAIEAGMSPREAGQHVASWAGFEEYRAERIATTEMQFAYNTAATTTYAAYGVTHVVADDGDGDEECADRHGQVFEVSEAESIEDHPNGTLDWLPVAPDYDPRQVQEELAQVRQIATSKFVEEGGGGRMAPPVVPGITPMTEGGALAPNEAQRAAAESWEQRIAAEEHARNPRPGYGGRFGNERGAIIDRNGNIIWESEHGEAASIDLAEPGVNAHLQPGNLVTHFHPSEGEVQLSSADVKTATEKQISIRAFHSQGQWAQFTPKPGGIFGSPRGTISFDRDVQIVKEANPNLSWAEAYDQTLREWAQGTFTTGRLPAPVEDIGPKIRAMSHDQMLASFDHGDYSFEDLLTHRLGVKGSPNEGIPNVVREPHTSMFDSRHERAILDAIDTAQQKGATFRLDIIRFTNTTKISTMGGGQNVAADMGTYQWSEGTADRALGLLTQEDAQAITIYRNTARYIDQYGGYAEHQIRLADQLLGETHEGFTDFYTVVTHELGHAIEKGVGAQAADAYKAINAIHELADATTRVAYEKRLAKELREVRSLLKNTRLMIEHVGEPDPGWTEYMLRSYNVRKELAVRLEAHEKELLRMREAAKKAWKDLQNEIAPTRYAGASPREDFAESVVWYLYKPETLRKYNPQRYDLIDKVFHPERHA